MSKQLKIPEARQPVDQTKSHEFSRRDAMTAIVRFSAYVAPATYVLIDSKSAFAQTCSGAQSELDILLATTGGSRRERRRRRREINQLRSWLQQNGC